MFPLKYVIDSNNEFILFNRNSSTIHYDVKRLFDGKIVGAGFCRIRFKGEILCSGRSESLNVDSRPKLDAEILNNYFSDGNVCFLVDGKTVPFDTLFATSIKDLEDYGFEILDSNADIHEVKYL